MPKFNWFIFNLLRAGLDSNCTLLIQRMYASAQRLYVTAVCPAHAATPIPLLNTVLG